MPAGNSIIGAASDLGLGFGLGDMLGQQQRDQTEDELRKRRLGLSGMGGGGLNFGMTGVAAADLGMPGAGRI